MRGESNFLKHALGIVTLKLLIDDQRHDHSMFGSIYDILTLFILLKLKETCPFAVETNIKPENDKEIREELPCINQVQAD